MKMDNKRPIDIIQYKDWLKKEHGISITERIKNYYESVAKKIHSDFKKSDFWLSLTNNLNIIQQEYVLEKKYELFIGDTNTDLYIKPFDSYLLKTYRRNVVDNKSWPDPPREGWILPNINFSEINDIIRTCFIVKYLDGVTFLVDKIQILCEESKLEYSVDYEAKEEGYYAAHNYVTFPCEIPGEDWDTTNIKILIELQVTTQLQEVIRKLLHKYYEDRRKSLVKSEIKWQWEYKSNEFATNYLGHILHYIEGMIMDVRDKQEESKL